MAAALHIGFLLFIIFFYSRIHGIISLTHHGDAVVLQALKNSWENTPANWNQSDDACGFPWKGVKCNSHSRVIVLLSTTSTSLKGELGGVIGDLTELQTLDLSFNKYLTGPLPPQLGNLSNLHSLFLVDCSFTGSIPDELGNLIQLFYMVLSGNKLSGEIPPSLGKLSQLRALDLSQNQLSGQLPISTGKTPGLDLLLKARDLVLYDNKHLTGSLPPQLGNLSSLNQLTLGGCSFMGSIPDELGNLTQLVILDLQENKLSGKIPPSLGKLSEISLLDLSDNQLSGQIPVSTVKTPGLDLLTKAKALDLSQNRLSGAIPDLSKMTSLRRLGLSNNAFDAAEAPTWFSTLPSLIYLDMEYGSLQGPVPTMLFSLPMIRRVKLGNNAFNGTLTIIGANISSHLRVVDLQKNKISAVTFDSNSTALMLAGNPICAEDPLDTDYCH